MSGADKTRKGMVPSRPSAITGPSELLAKRGLRLAQRMATTSADRERLAREDSAHFEKALRALTIGVWDLSPWRPVRSDVLDVFKLIEEVVPYDLIGIVSSMGGEAFVGSPGSLSNDSVVRFEELLLAERRADHVEATIEFDVRGFEGHNEIVTDSFRFVHLPTRSGDSLVGLIPRSPERSHDLSRLLEAVHFPLAALLDTIEDVQRRRERGLQILFRRMGPVLEQLAGELQEARRAHSSLAVFAFQLGGVPDLDPAVEPDAWSYVLKHLVFCLEEGLLVAQHKEPKGHSSGLIRPRHSAGIEDWLYIGLLLDTAKSQQVCVLDDLWDRLEETLAKFRTVPSFAWVSRLKLKGGIVTSDEVVGETTAGALIQLAMERLRLRRSEGGHGQGELRL